MTDYSESSAARRLQQIRDDYNFIPGDSLLPRRTSISRAKRRRVELLLRAQSAKFRNSSWYPLPPLDRNNRPPAPSLLYLGETCLLYARKINNFQSLSEAGKTWLALAAAVQELTNGNDVVFIDFEDDQVSVEERLIQCGVSKAIVDQHFHYARADDPFGPDLVDGLEAFVITRNTTLVIIDGVTSAIGLLGKGDFGEDMNARIVRFKRTLTERLARTGAAVLTIDHMPASSSDDRSHAIDGVQKKNVITGSSFTLENDAPLGRGLVGKSSLYLAKDKNGHLHGRGKKRYMGVVEFISDPDNHQMTVRLVDDQGSTNGKTQSDVAREKVSKYLAASPSESFSQSKLERAGLGNATLVREAAAWLASNGFASLSPGPKNSKNYQHTKPFEIGEGS